MTHQEFREQIANAAREQSLESVLDRLRQLRAITGPTETFNVPPNLPGIFAPDWGRPGCCPNWAFQYCDDVHAAAEKREEARRFLQELTGRGWEEARDLCRERDVLHDVLGGVPGPLSRFIDAALAPIAAPTAGEKQARGMFLSLVRNRLMATYMLPTRDELAESLRETRAHFEYLDPNRLALR